MPIIYHVDNKNRFFVMDYVNGIDIHQLFTSINLKKPNDLKRAVDLSAIALAEFHKVFKKIGINDEISDLRVLVKKKT